MREMHSPPAVIDVCNPPRSSSADWCFAAPFSCDACGHETQRRGCSVKRCMLGAGRFKSTCVSSTDVNLR